ncbi:MAG: substrate-binding domain-containing protein, partial [Lachnospiraceae bacterium]|nr:substrate-binding domain-containing protein [Lachnospiraceae bacterium]
MAVTIKEIAEKTGVSRGTIDRVLHGRGSVNAGTAELVMKTAEEMGYKPNRVGRALAARKKQYRIGVIITSGNTQLEDGVKAVENLAGDYGASIDIYHLEEVSPEKQAELIEKLAERDHFVVLQPIDDALVRSALKRAYDKGICCITVGTDIDGIEKICHVGPDHEKSGAAAAGIVGLIRGNSASVGIITGKTVTTEDKKKAESFKKVLEERYRGASVEVSYKADNAADEAYSDTMHMLEGYSNINTLYVIGGGIEGICRAAKAS